MGSNDYTSSMDDDNAQFDQSFFSDDDDWYVIIKDLSPAGSGRFSFENYSNVYTKKVLNKMSVFTINFEYITDADKTWIVEGNDVFIYKGTTLQLKGRITRSAYTSDYGGIVEGYGKEVLLKDSIYYDETNNTFRKEWTSETLTNIATALIGSKMNVGTIDAYGTISGYRIENDNRLRGLIGLAQVVNYDWYVDEDTSDPGHDKFNLVDRRGESSTQQTFTMGDDIFIVKDESDRENVYNKIIVTGYGDGVNQLLSVGTHYTSVRTTLSAAATAVATTISLTDASDFDSSGAIWIGMEYITYSGKSTNNLTGCVRGVSNLYSIDAYAHDAGIEVIDAQYTESAPQGGAAVDPSDDPDTTSSAHVYGLRETNFKDRAVIDQNILDRLTQRLIAKYYYLITRMNFDVLSESLTCDIGDTVTVVDSVLGLNTEYQLIGIERNFGWEGESTTIQLSNSRLTWFEELNDLQNTVDINDKYGQGSTNIYVMNKDSNADSTHGVKIKFYIPNEAVAINKIRCGYDIGSYRIDSDIETGAESAHTHGMEHTHGIPALVINSTTSANGDSGWDSFVGNSWGYIPWNNGASNTDSYTKTGTAGDYVALSAIQYYLTGASAGDIFEVSISATGTKFEGEFMADNNGDFKISIPAQENLIGTSVSVTTTNRSGGNWADATHGLQVSVKAKHTHGISATTTVSDTSDASSSATTTVGSTHKHNMNYGIHEEASGSYAVTDVIVKVDGVDKTTVWEALNGTLTYTRNSTEDADTVLTAWMSGTIVGAWHSIEFIPNGNARIDINLMVQCWVKSQS